jgi:hypothetical protein
MSDHIKHRVIRPREAPAKTWGIIYLTPTGIKGIT